MASGGVWLTGAHRAAAHSKRMAPCRAASEVEATADVEAAAAAPPKQAAVWELDFCSRPIMDERKKKVWELLICDPERTFEYSEYFPNNKINSVQVRAPAGDSYACGHDEQRSEKQSGDSYARHRASKLSSRSSSTAYTATSSPSTTSSGTSTTNQHACVLGGVVHTQWLSGVLTCRPLGRRTRT